MKTFYKLKNLDVFKNGVSLSGLVLKYFMRGTKSEFYLFNEDDTVTTEYPSIKYFAFYFPTAHLMIYHLDSLSVRHHHV